MFFQLSVPAYDADLMALSLNKNTVERVWGLVMGSGFGPGRVPGFLKNSSPLPERLALIYSQISAVKPF